MQRKCKDCGGQYSPIPLSGGMLPMGYKKCPFCNSTNTASTGAVAGADTAAGRGRGPSGKVKFVPPTSNSMGHLRKKPPTH